jgi:hypothetical protein
MSINASTDHARCCSTPNPSSSSCCQVVQTFEETVQRDSSRALVNQYSQDDQPFSFYACPLPGCHAIFEESTSKKQQVISHINKELSKEPSLVHSPQLVKFMLQFNYWFCTACCGIFKRCHKGNHSRPAGSTDLIIVINDIQPPPFSIMHSPERPVPLVLANGISTNLEWSNLFPAVDELIHPRPLDLYPDLEVRLRSNHIPIISFPPNRLVKATCEEFTRILTIANGDPSNPHKHILLTMFVVCVLRRVKRNDPGFNSGHSVKL